MPRIEITQQNAEMFMRCLKVVLNSEKDLTTDFVNFSEIITGNWSTFEELLDDEHLEKLEKIRTALQRKAVESASR